MPERSNEMELLDHPIPYNERCIVTSTGNAFIWPFINVSKGDGPYELFLDNNALLRTEWLEELPDFFARKIVINPWLAFVEQWVSNPDFRHKPKERISSFIHPFQIRGISFPDCFAETMEKRLRDNEDQNRNTWSLLFLYIAILKKMMEEKLPQDKFMGRLEELGKADVPRFCGCLMLGALIAFLKSRQSFKLAGDSQPSISFLESFFAYQPSKKSEPEYISVPYMRNRSGDLGLWYLLPMLMQHRFMNAGEPVVVTRDKALFKVIFRLLPPVLEPSRTVSFSLDSQSLSGTLFSELASSIKQVCSAPFDPPRNDEEKLRRMVNLYGYAKSCCTQDVEKHELDKAWSEWFQPGFGRAMITT